MPTASSPATTSSAALQPWIKAPTPTPLLPGLQAHSLHTYFGVSPESPDGRWVLVFTSQQADAHVGSLLIVDRTLGTSQTPGTSHALGESRTLATSVEVEDSHRQANQQWVCNGDFIVYMDLVDGQWSILRVDPRSLVKTVLARGRQLGWGRPELDEVPLCGPHWAPGAYRDLELLNVRTGRIRTALTATQVVEEHRDFVAATFPASQGIFSIFFPMISPDGQRVFFKLSSPATGLFRSGKGSRREGLFVYDLKSGHSIGLRPASGHPTWLGDSRHILDRAHRIDTQTITAWPFPNLPAFNASTHVIASPDGRVLVADVRGEPYLPQPNHWSIVVIDPSSGQYHIAAAAPTAGNGTTSWRPSHPHPAFNTQGNRLYFNLPQAHWTTLMVLQL